jgi:subtilisin family serine protease
VTRRSALHKAGSAAALAALVALPVFSASPALAYSSQEWQLDYLKATQAWTMSQGSGVTVAIIDSGCQPIPDLSGQLVSGADFSTGSSSIGNGETDQSPDGHGTNMAVDVAGNGTDVTGLAPQAKILPVRVTDGTGYTTAEMVAAIQYAITQHVGVINISLGGSADDPTVDSALTQAMSANIVVVGASGNESASSVDYPAAAQGVVAVGATDQNGALWPQSNTGAQVALVAPGVNIYADDNNNQQGTSSGTSNSAAFVSAAAALVRSEHPSWTAGQVIRDLISTADPGSGQTAGQHSNQYGYGIVDPVKALQASAPSETSNPLLGASSPASANAAGASNSPAATASGSKSSSGLIIVIVIIALVVLGVGTLIVILAKRRGGRGGGPKPPMGPGGGYPQQGPNPYAQQQNPFQQQQNPYGQPQPQGQGNYPPPQQQMRPPQPQGQPQQQPPPPYGYGGGNPQPQQQQPPRSQPNPYGQQQQQPPQAPPGSYYGGQR